MCDCSDYRKAIWFQSGWTKNWILDVSLNVDKESFFTCWDVSAAFLLTRIFVGLLHLVLLSLTEASRDTDATFFRLFCRCSAGLLLTLGSFLPLQMDSTLYAEFLMWKENPSMERSSAFLSRIYREDIGPCLSFTRSEVRRPESTQRPDTQHNTLHLRLTRSGVVHSCPSWCRAPWRATPWPSSLWPCRRCPWSGPRPSSAAALSELFTLHNDSLCSPFFRHCCTI